MLDDAQYAKSIGLDISDIDQIDFKNPTASSKKLITSLMYIFKKIGLVEWHFGSSEIWSDEPASKSFVFHRQGRAVVILRNKKIFLRKTTRNPKE